MEAHITHILQETPIAKSFILDKNIDFIPGQSIRVSIPEREEGKIFSIATSPTEGVLGFTTLMGNSELKKYLDNIKEGDLINFDGPLGNRFNFDENIPRPVMMIAGGVGIAPFRSMVKYAIDTDFPASIKLLHSIKTKDDLIYEDDLDRWGEESDRFWYIPTLTQSSPGDWEGELERIDRFMIERHVDEGSIFYVCGKPDFVENVVNILREMEIPDELIKTKRFAGY